MRHATNDPHQSPGMTLPQAATSPQEVLHTESVQHALEKVRLAGLWLAVNDAIPEVTHG